MGRAHDLELGVGVQQLSQDPHQLRLRFDVKASVDIVQQQQSRPFGFVP